MNPLAVAAVAIVALFAWMKKDEEPEEPGALTPSFKPTKPADPDPDGGFVPSQPQPIFPVTPNPAPVPTPPTLDPGGDPPPPPNVSGDSEGYNTDLYKIPADIRKSFHFLGYVSDGTSNTPPSQSRVKAFQGDYNQASIMALWDAEGWVEEDGFLGPMTMRALEIAVAGTDGLGLDDAIRGYQWSQEFGL